MNSDVNVAYNNFADILQSGFDQCFPLKRLSRRKANDKVWITKALIKSSKVKARLYKNGFQLGDFVVKQNIKITKKYTGKLLMKLNVSITKPCLIRKPTRLNNYGKI